MNERDGNSESELYRHVWNGMQICLLGYKYGDVAQLSAIAQGCLTVLPGARAFECNYRSPRGSGSSLRKAPHQCPGKNYLTYRSYATKVIALRDPGQRSGD